MSKFKILGMMVLIAFVTGIDSGWRCGGRGEREGGNSARVLYDGQSYTQGVGCGGPTNPIHFFGPFLVLLVGN